MIFGEKEIEMDQIEFPDKDIWHSRKEWFENMLEEGQHPMASYFVSDHATALLVDLQSCYCCGSFLAVIILSISIIDAQLRDTSAVHSKIGTADLLKNHFSGENIDWLRKLRNRLVHANNDDPVLTIDDQYTGRTLMEENARKAIAMVIHAFFQEPET